MAVSACSVLENFNVIETVSLGQFTCFVDTFSEPFFFKLLKNLICGCPILDAPAGAAFTNSVVFYEF